MLHTGCLSDIFPSLELSDWPIQLSVQVVVVVVFVVVVFFVVVVVFFWGGGDCKHKGFLLVLPARYVWYSGTLQDHLRPLDLPLVWKLIYKYQKLPTT